MVRVRKEDVFQDMPPIIWDTVPVPLDKSMMPDADLDQLNKVVNKIFAATGAAAGMDVIAGALEALGRDIGLMSLRRMLGAAKLRGASEYIVDMLDSLPEDRKILVFAHHAHVIAALARHLGEYLPAVLVGTTPPRSERLPSIGS